MSNNTNSSQIKKIFDDKQLTDLNKFISKVDSLNFYNSYLIYLFHIVQSTGIIISSYAASSNDTKLFWAGIGLNMLASLIHVFEKINEGQIKKLDSEIIKIKSGTYVTEDSLIDIESNDNGAGSCTQPNSLNQPLINNNSQPINYQSTGTN
jgi:hypothetical protein